MHSKLSWDHKMGFYASGDSGDQIFMDAGTPEGGSDSGVRPMELLLHALGGCTGMDVVSILKKMQIDLEDFSIEISGERAPEHPKKYTDIHLIFKVMGPNIDRDKVNRAVELSQTKYCSIAASLNSKLTYEVLTE
ncbi:MAG TPA: peroxiredoxin [Firmicutes bacterium]|jgi:putative redox protein|nr:peroxiredoxin [Bacillota bacterium]